MDSGMLMSAHAPMVKAHATHADTAVRRANSHTDHTQAHSPQTTIMDMLTSLGTLPPQPHGGTSAGGRACAVDGDAW